MLLAACGLFSASAWRLAGVDGLPGVPTKPVTRADVGVLLSRPAEGAAFRQLADDADARGRQLPAHRLYAIAVRRNPRDVPAQLRMVDVELARQDAQSAMRHLDAALRVDPDRSEPRLLEFLRSLADPAILRALASRLATDPPWRADLPRLLSDIDPVSAQALLSALSVRPLPPAELALRASLLESLGDPRQARAAWSAGLPAAARPFDGPIFDGGFEYGAGPEPYGWRLPTSPETLIGLETSHVAQGHSALSVLLQGRAVAMPDVSQRLALSPGNYVLVLQADSSLAGSGLGFAWTVSCDDPVSELGQIDLPRHTRGWQRFSTAFVVPPQCPRQSLRLVQPGHTVSERSLAGRLGVDAMQILPVRR